MLNVGNNYTNNMKLQSAGQKRNLSADQARNLVKQNYNLYNEGLISSQELMKFMRQILKRAGIEERSLKQTMRNKI